MSLGIISIWRARPLRLGPTIPREPLLLRRSHLHPRLCPRPSALIARLSYTTASESPEREDDRNQAEDSVEPSVQTTPPAEAGTSPKQQQQRQKKRKPREDKEDSKNHIKLARSVLVKPAKVYTHISQTRKARTDHHRTVVQLLLHEHRRLHSDGDHVHWAETLDTLSDITPVQSPEWIEDGLRLDLPAEAMARILEDAGDDKIGAIRSRTGAAIKVSREDKALLLSGNKFDIHAAAEEVRRIAGTMTVTRLSSQVEHEHGMVEPATDTPDRFFTPPLSREEGGWVRRSWIYDEVSKSVTIPKAWTAKTFEEYICAIVDTQIAPHLHHPTYHRARSFKDHERAVVDLLRATFGAAPLEMVASCSAFKVALSFMCRKGAKYLPQVRQFITMMDRRGLRMDTKVFNILLTAVVKTKDLRNFHRTVHQMGKRNIVPNLETYLLFMRMFEAIEVKIQILKVIYTKNLHISPSAPKGVAAELGPFEAESAIRQGKSIAAFVAEQETRYGPDWLTCQTGNLVLDVLCRHNRLDPAWRLLDIMYERRVPDTKQPNIASFNTLMTHAHSIKKVPLAINILRKMYACGVHPDATTLTLLFDTAWRARLRTTIVAVWRYACLARLTTWRMRRRIWSVLTHEKTNENVFHAVGGPALVRELLGGHAHALRRHRAAAALLLYSDGTGSAQEWDVDVNMYNRRSTVLAAKTLPLAFADFGPAVPLAEVLVQSVLVDLRCMRASKEGRLKEELASAAVKSLRLWRRLLPMEEGWTELVKVPSSADPTSIGMADKWEDDVWTSEGWAGEYAFGKGRNSTKRRRVAWFRAILTERHLGNLAEDHSTEKLRIQHVMRKHTKLMAIINPRVWDDTLSPDEEDPLQTPVQRQNQEAMLQALQELENAHRERAQRLQKTGRARRRPAKRSVSRAEWDCKYSALDNESTYEQSWDPEEALVENLTPQLSEEGSALQREASGEAGVLQEVIHELAMKTGMPPEDEAHGAIENAAAEVSVSPEEHKATEEDNSSCSEEQDEQDDRPKDDKEKS